MRVSVLNDLASGIEPLADKFSSPVLGPRYRLRVGLVKPLIQVVNDLGGTASLGTRLDGGFGSDVRLDRLKIVDQVREESQV